MRQTFNGINYMFFWGGMFSNWYISDEQFTVDGITYNCGEQYMMYQKAMTFNDKETAKKILDEIVPSEQKKLGRLVKNYNDATWNRVRYNVVKRGLFAKFSQNENLKEYLHKYKGYQIVEASPYDRIWGIGYYEQDAINNINNWGENLLGKILTELAQEIK